MDRRPKAHLWINNDKVKTLKKKNGGFFFFKKGYL